MNDDAPARERARAAVAGGIGMRGAPSLVLDVGSSAVKAALLSDDGVTQERATASIDTQHGAGGVVEQSADAWREAAETAIQALPGRRHARRIAITGAMQNLTLLDERGAPLRPTLLYADTRARDHVDVVRERLGAEAWRAATGNELDASSFLPKLLWLGQHEPTLLARARHVAVATCDALALAWTGVFACDTTSASTTGLIELATRRSLPDAAFAAVDLPSVPARLPAWVPGGARIGGLLPDVAARLGLTPGTAVHVGPGDAGAATIGAGAGTPGVMSAAFGTSGWVAGSSATRGDTERGVFTLAHPRADLHVVVAPLLSAGANVAWLQGVLEPGVDVEASVSRALARPPTGLVYLPYLQGERSPIRDPLARACFVGIDAATTRDDLLRAVLEGIAFAFAHALDALAPAGVTRLVISGGGARSQGVVALLAAATRTPVAAVADAQDAPLRGALRAAQVEVGEAEDHALTPDVAFEAESDPALAEYLRRKGAVYRSLHPALAAAFADLARL